MAPHLFRPSTWSATRCEPVCDAHNVSQALRYRRPQTCHKEGLSELLKASLHPIDATVLSACKHGTCPFEPNLLHSFPSRISESAISPHAATIPAYSSCAVVGSGAGAKGYGNEIDGHDAVIRINDSPTLPRFRVGNRTTHQILACWAISQKKFPCAKNSIPQAQFG